MTLCLAGRTGTAAFLASDRLVTQFDYWTVEMDGVLSPKLALSRIEGGWVGIAGAGHAGYVDALVAMASSPTSFWPLANLAATCSDVGLRLVHEQLRSILRELWDCREAQDESFRNILGTNDAQHATWRLKYLKGKSGVESVVEASILNAVVRSGDGPRIWRLDAGGTLVRPILDPIAAIGSGEVAYSAWRAAVQTPFCDNPTEVNLVADLVCILSLGLDVTGVGGVPSIARLAVDGMSSMAPENATWLANLAGIYLNGGVSRSVFEQHISAVLQRPTEAVQWLGKSLGLEAMTVYLLGIGPLPYSFWGRRVKSPSGSLIKVGPFSVAGEGLRPRPTGDSPAPRVLCVFDDQSIAAAVAAPVLQRAAFQPFLRSIEDGGELVQAYLNHHLIQGTVFEPAAVFPEPFIRLALSPLFRFLRDDCTRRSATVPSKVIGILFELWTGAILDRWRNEAMLSHRAKPVMDTVQMNLAFFGGERASAGAGFPSATSTERLLEAIKEIGAEGGTKSPTPAAKRLFG